MCVIYTNVSFIYAHLGVKFQLQKLCQCKKNDNYQVWIILYTMLINFHWYHPIWWVRCMKWIFKSKEKKAPSSLLSNYLVATTCGWKVSTFRFRGERARVAPIVSVCFLLQLRPLKNVFRFVFYYFVRLADKERSSKHAFLWLRILRDTLIICLSKLSAHTTWKFQISHQLLNALNAFIDLHQQPTNPPNLHISRRAQLQTLIYFVKSQLKISGAVPLYNLVGFPNWHVSSRSKWVGGEPVL